MTGKHTITNGKLEIQGEGQVQVRPDIATVMLTVVTDGLTADEAVSKNAKKANDVVDRMQKFDIPRDNMKTTGLNVYPLYETDPKTNVTKLVGYRVQDSLSIEAPIALAGKVFDAGVAAGANESSGMSFGIKNERPYREQARELAIKAARGEAEAVCKSMGVTLIGPLNIVVNQGGGPIRVLSERLTDKASTPALPGQQTISASVQVTFEYHT